MLGKLLFGKTVLFIPIYSMRDYVTGEYNLLADGNMARIISKLNEIDFKLAIVLYPENSINFEEVIMPVRNKNIKWISCNAYGVNALETRLELNKFIYCLTEKVECDYELDYIVSEPNVFTKFLADNYNAKTIYWCVASITSEMCPWFVKGFVDTDKEIAKKVPTAVCTKTQVEALGGKAYIEPFYNAKAFDYKVIFFPFRLSDKSYMFNEFKKVIDNIYESGMRGFKVLFTDPNFSLTEKLNEEVFVKVPSDKDVYLSILKSKPIIPYFEDSNNVLHISIFEFMYYNCNVILFKNDNIHNESFIEIEQFKDFEKVLRRLLDE